MFYINDNNSWNQKISKIHSWTDAVIRKWIIHPIFFFNLLLDQQRRKVLLFFLFLILSACLIRTLQWRVGCSWWTGIQRCFPEQNVGKSSEEERWCNSQKRGETNRGKCKGGKTGINQQETCGQNCIEKNIQWNDNMGKKNWLQLEGSRKIDLSFGSCTKV